MPVSNGHGRDGSGLDSSRTGPADRPSDLGATDLRLALPPALEEGPGREAGNWIMSRLRHERQRSENGMQYTRGTQAIAVVTALALLLIAGCTRQGGEDTQSMDSAPSTATTSPPVSPSDADKSDQHASAGTAETTEPEKGPDKGRGVLEAVCSSPEHTRERARMLAVTLRTTLSSALKDTTGVPTEIAGDVIADVAQDRFQTNNAMTLGATYAPGKLKRTDEVREQFGPEDSRHSGPPMTRVFAPAGVPEVAETYWWGLTGLGVGEGGEVIVVYIVFSAEELDEWS